MADAKNTVLFPYETLKKLSMDAFQKFGFSEKEADIIQDVLLTSDLFGIQSHQICMQSISERRVTYEF